MILGQVYEKYCMQNNQLSTKKPIEIKDDSYVLLQTTSWT